MITSKGIVEGKIPILGREKLKKIGADGRSRTCDHLIRSEVLYPAELRPHRFVFKSQKIHSFLGSICHSKISHFLKLCGPYVDPNSRYPFSSNR